MTDGCSSPAGFVPFKTNGIPKPASCDYNSVLADLYKSSSRNNKVGNI